MRSLIFALSILFSFTAFTQLPGMTFQEAEIQGISIKHLDSIYKSALDSDTTFAVFKTDLEQQQMQEAYGKLLQDFGKFLSGNKFQWDKPARCFNRIYFSPDGKIDYFLFNFSGSEEDKPSAGKQEEFKRLLNEFISTYAFSLTAPVKFAQCSPVTYKP